MEVLQLIFSPVLWGAGAGLTALYLAGLAIYRLYFSPIAKFPGPKLAALTLWYEFYFDVIKQGQYTWEIGRMHDKYGPIVRINPYELHIKDQEYYDVIYTSSTSKRDKWDWSAKMFGVSGSMFNTLAHAHHRARRAPLAGFFSKQSVAKLEPMIVKTVDNLCRRFREARETGEPVNLGWAYGALTMDVITEYCFSKPYGCVDAPDYSHLWPDSVDAISENSHINKQFGWLVPLMKKFPLWLVEAMNPNMMLFINFQIGLAKQIMGIMKGETDTKGSKNLSVFEELLNSDIPASEKTLQRLVDEGQALVGAGQVTTTFYLKTTSYHLIANPDIMAKLKAELAEAMPDPNVLLPQSKLEQLPYLRAVVLEGFRKSYGVTHRLQRISPDAPLQFQQWVIPPGTPVGMTSIFMHDNPEKFPEPDAFKPERWLTSGEKGNGGSLVQNERAEKYLVNFSKGTRQCLGINLAHAEIYLTLAAVFRRFDFILFETTKVDATVAHDFFNPQPAKSSKGVRVIVK